MKTNHYRQVINAVSLSLLAATAAARAEDETFWGSTNRVTLSLQFGLNIKSSFKGIGNGLYPSMNQAPGFYDNGYVFTDISGNAGGQSWYWGYNNASQNNSANNTISFDRTTGLPDGTASARAGDSAGTPGFQLDFNRQLGEKADWHNMRYGLDAAVNFLPISISHNDTINGTATKQTDVYSYTPGTTPPSAPYQGSYDGPGFVINVPAVPSTTTSSASVFSQDHFDASLFGLHLGPYVEIPFGKRRQFTLSLAGGLAVGVLAANDSWSQTLSIAGTGTATANGGGNNLDVLWGWYAGATANYQLSKRWGVAGGVQFQDLGTYSHSFNGRQVNLDLSRSLLLLVGASYNF